jgi:microsomal dipeptidase-like Zn-dependent dipeptidase
MLVDLLLLSVLSQESSQNPDASHPEHLVRDTCANRTLALSNARVSCANPIEGELDRLDLLYGYGVRVMGIADSGSNMLGGGREEAFDGGLTAFGRKAVERMNRLGMLIDASRCGMKTALDVIEASEKPVVLGHCDPERPFPDEVLKACAEKGGLVCANAGSLARAVELVGIGHVAVADPADMPLCGFPDADMQKILGGNAIELLRQVWIF